MKLRAVKGMNDILPEEARRFQTVERIFRETVGEYGFAELRTPIVEELSLFHKSTGETSEVVQKQMFLLDRHREKLALRPEGTPSSARVYIGNNQHAVEPITKWFYIGPMFRAEQPQRGRYRQFYQAGCELYGDPGPLCDAEILSMLLRMASRLGLRGVRMKINTLGEAAARAAYRERLSAYFEPLKDSLSDHAKQRLGDNPLRILDSKDPRDQKASADAPALLESLTPEDRQHWNGLLEALDTLGVEYEIDPQLVRGLDYYTRTCFELIAQGDEVGSQNAILGGGRYDGMLEGLGGRPTPAIGFAMGLERVLLAMGKQVDPLPPLVFLAPLGSAAQLCSLRFAEELRERKVRVELDGRGNSLKSMLRRANNMGARLCIVIGETEVTTRRAQVKDLSHHRQSEISFDQLITHVNDQLTREASDTGSSVAVPPKADI